MKSPSTARHLLSASSTVAHPSSLKKETQSPSQNQESVPVVQWLGTALARLVRQKKRNRRERERERERANATKWLEVANSSSTKTKIERIRKPSIHSFIHQTYHTRVRLREREREREAKNKKKGGAHNPRERKPSINNNPEIYNCLALQTIQHISTASNERK